MLAKAFCLTLQGVEADIVEIEVDVSPGLPSYHIVGLADTSIRESRERVRSCLKHSQYKFPLARISINLAPADIFKYGTQFDLGIAVALLVASSQIKGYLLDKIFLGELALDGTVRPVRGVLVMLDKAQKRGYKEAYIPKENIKEAQYIKTLKIHPVSSLDQVLDDLLGTTKRELEKDVRLDFEPEVQDFPVELNSIVGQEFAKRGLEIAAAGGHNILMEGVPGSGKTMLAQGLSSLIPAPTFEEQLEISKVYSIAGEFKEKIFRPFRSPHQTVSLQGFVGGGRIPVPGEISLAHNGVLFLDEFPEFPRVIVESLRQPLESGVIKISRIYGSHTFPAKFILVAAQNPCPCGYHGEYDRCICAPGDIVRYKRKISGPILDRIDLMIRVKKVSLFDNFQILEPESLATIKLRIENARRLQYKRLDGRLNKEMSNKEVEKCCAIDCDTKILLKNASEKYDFSMRVYFRLLKVARTVADLDGSVGINSSHVSEALRYRFW